MDCAICEKIKEKKALIVYEDEALIAVLPSKPVVPGHVKVMPKKHYSKLDEMSEELVQDIFFLANFASSTSFEVLQAHGTNIILNETDEHLCIDIIPRKEDDNLEFMWKPKQLPPEEMDDAHKNIKDKAFVIGKTSIEEQAGAKQASPDDAEPGASEGKEEVIKVPDEDKTNYLIKHLQKIP